MAIILIIKEASKKHEIILSESPFTIGRSRKSDLKIDDSRLSGLHCSLKLSGGRAFITDLDSTNGTTLNNKQIKQSPLYLDDIVKTGNTSLTLLKTKMTDDEIKLHTSNYRNAIAERLAETNSTSSEVQRLKERRRARAKAAQAPVPEHVRAKNAIGSKKNKDKEPFAILTRILKIK